MPFKKLNHLKENFNEATNDDIELMIDNVNIDEINDEEVPITKQIRQYKRNINKLTNDLLTLIKLFDESENEQFKQELKQKMEKSRRLLSNCISEYDVLLVSVCSKFN